MSIRVLCFALLGPWLLSVTACSLTTVFTGEAQYGGPRKCYHVCQKENMVMAGYVYIGEYSSACVCEVLGRTGQARRSVVMNGATAAMAGAAAGVESQRRAAAAAAAASASASASASPSATASASPSATASASPSASSAGAPLR